MLYPNKSRRRERPTARVNSSIQTGNFKRIIFNRYKVYKQIRKWISIVDKLWLQCGNADKEQTVAIKRGINGDNRRKNGWQKKHCLNVNGMRSFKCEIVLSLMHLQMCKCREMSHLLVFCFLLSCLTCLYMSRTFGIRYTKRILWKLFSIYVQYNSIVINLIYLYSLMQSPNPNGKMTQANNNNNNKNQCLT